MIIKKMAMLLLMVFSIFTFTSIFSPPLAQAASAAECTGNESIKILPKWYKYLNPTPTANGCELSPGFPQNISRILLAVFEILLRIVGIITVVFVIYGGFQYLTSTGEPDKAKAGRTTIMNALVGMMLAILATVIVNIVGRNLWI